MDDTGWGITGQIPNDSVLQVLKALIRDDPTIDWVWRAAWRLPNTQVLCHFSQARWVWLQRANDPMWWIVGVFFPNAPHALTNGFDDAKVIWGQHGAICIKPIENEVLALALMPPPTA